MTARDRFEGAKSRIKAPPVMEFDPQGNVVNSWGDSTVLGDYLHDCQVDKNNNMWITGARSGFVQKFSHDGKLLLQIGKSGVFDSSDGTAQGKPLNSNAAQFFGPSAVDDDPQNGDVYVADGHGGGNTRIAVLEKWEIPAPVADIPHGSGKTSSSYRTVSGCPTMVWFMCAIGWPIGYRCST